MIDEDLQRLADAAGVSSHWTSAAGDSHTVAADTLRTILQALGLPCATAMQARSSLSRLQEEQNDGDLPPLLTVEIGQSLHLPTSCCKHGDNYRIELEHGGRLEGQLQNLQAGDVTLAPIDQTGYHRLIIGDASATLAVAPARCFGFLDALQASDARATGDGDGEANSGAAARTKTGANAENRLWGLAAQLYSLRRAGGGGIGDYSALATLAAKVATTGAAALAISPVHAMFSADLHRVSPYGPSSRLFLNAMHIDPAAVLGEPAMRDALGAIGVDAEQYAQLEDLSMVEWPQASAVRLALLRHLHAQFRLLPAVQRTAFKDFCTQGGEALHDHARFEALYQTLVAGPDGSDRHHNWHNWPAELHDPRGPAVAAFADENALEVEFHAFLQWQAALGVAAAQKAARNAGMPIGLISDLAVGAETGGSQAWSRQQEMLAGLSIGAPPDQMNAQGQNWGLGAFSPRALQRSGYHAYLEMLRAAFAYAGGIRIDHVLGLGRLWLVPDGAAAIEGAYVRYPLDDLLRLVALESWRHRAVVIGEDLGTVPEGFSQRLARSGVFGIQVLLFERDGAHFRPPEKWRATAMATTTTHDTPTFAGWWEGRDIGWRTRLNLLATGATEESERAARADDRAALWRTLLAAGCARGPEPAATAAAAPIAEALTLLGKSPAPLVMLPLEDALGLPEQPNLPGTVDTHPNWRRRLPLPVDTLLDDPALQARVHSLRQARTPVTEQS